MKVAPYARITSMLTAAALAVSCAPAPPAPIDASHPISVRTASQAVMTEKAKASPEAPVRPSSRILDGGACPRDWAQAMSIAWGYADDLAASRSVFPDRRMDIDRAIPLVDRMPRWKQGEVARTSLAYAFALYAAAEDAHDADEADREAKLLSTVEIVVQQAWSAYMALRDEEADPCYRPPDGGAGG